MMPWPQTDCVGTGNVACVLLMQAGTFAQDLPAVPQPVSPWWLYGFPILAGLAVGGVYCIGCAGWTAWKERGK